MSAFPLRQHQLTIAGSRARAIDKKVSGTDTENAATTEDTAIIKDPSMVLSTFQKADDGNRRSALIILTDKSRRKWIAK